MKSTDSRAQRHYRRDQLALRMVRHGARSSTIDAWTGLSANRIRTLVQHHGDAPPIRHRGQPPRRVGYFFRTLRITTHAATLASLYELFEVLPNAPLGMPARRFRTLDRGEAVCTAYEMYCAMVNTPAIRFEHAMLLATALAEGDEISLQPCPQCTAALLVDHLALARDACTHCRPSAHLPAIPGSAGEPRTPERLRRPHIQLRLFTPPADDPRPAHPICVDVSQTICV